MGSTFCVERISVCTEPNAFLLTQRHLLRPGMSCLAVADGEGRNGAWLAGQGLEVLSVDASPVASAKAQKLAVRHGVNLECEVADLLDWDWGESRYDLVAAIFLQFAAPEQRGQLFFSIKRTLRPGGLLLMQGYTPRQLEYGTGGPPVAENMYTAALLREAFGDMEILHLSEHDDFIHEGSGHHGMSALVDLVARRRAAPPGP